MTTLLDFAPSNLKLEEYAWNVISGLHTFTADDLHVLETEIKRHDRDKRVIGSLLKSFKAQGKIAKVGYVTSNREECHHRPIIKWEVLK